MQQIKSITVIGGGTAGWMSACYMAKQGFVVTLVESPNVPNIGVGESCLPGLQNFCTAMGLQDAEWMPESNAVYKLGIHHVNWLREGSRWRHGFRFNRNDGENFPWELTADGQIPSDIVRYSYHIDAIAFGKMLKRRVADPLGVKYIQAHINDVQLNEQGYVAGVVLDNGTTVTSDFYIDCSGMSRLLSGKVGITFKPYGNIPNDRAIACPQESYPEGIHNYTITYAEEAGWIWDTALTHRRGCGYTYSSAFSTDEQALQTYLKYNPNSDMDKLRFIKFTSHYAENPLEKNVLAVGFASGFIEPLEATGIALIQYYIETFAKVVNTGRDPRVYNKAVHRITQELYEFVLTNYTLSKRTDTEYWRYFQDLEQKINTRDMVLSRANQPDLDDWSKSSFFIPYNWWSKANHFELY